MFAFAKAKYAFTGMDTGDLRFDKGEVFLVTKKEGAWWWGMKEGESDEASEDEPNTRRVRIMEPSSADHQGRFPKNYVIEITQDEYRKLKKEQEQTRHERKLEEAERRKKQEEVWTQKMEQIRAEEEARRRQERTQLKLQKVFGSEGDILLLRPRLQKEDRLDTLVSPRQREKKNERDKEAEKQREKSDGGGGDGERREKSNKSSKTSSGDNRELKSSGEKRSKAFSVVREERAHSADDSSGGAALLLVGGGRHHPSPLATPSRSCGDIGGGSSGVDDQSTGGSGGITRKWLKKKKSLPRSLDKVASDYKEQRRQQEETAELGAAATAAAVAITPATPTTSDEIPSVGDSSSASGSASASAGVDEGEGGEEWDGAVTTRRRQVSASTAFMNDMNYLAPELAMRAEEARKKRMRGRNAVSLDRA